MKWLKRTIALAALVMMMTGAMRVQALNYKFDAWLYPQTKTLKLDLNKDGKKETIKMQCRSYGDSWDSADNYYDVYINKKKVLKEGEQIWIMDINQKDKYIEIVVSYKHKSGLHIYRYNGKKLVLYASAKVTTFHNLMKKNTIYFAGYDERYKIKTSGKGRLIVCNEVYVPSAEMDELGDAFCNVEFNYIVKKNLIKYDQSASCKVNNVEGTNGILRINKKWNAYKYPRFSSNKKVFVINKGDKVKVTNFKFTAKYTYMKVKKLKTNKTGWVFFRTKDIENQEFD